LLKGDFPSLSGSLMLTTLRFSKLQITSSCIALTPFHYSILHLSKPFSGIIIGPFFKTSWVFPKGGGSYFWQILGNFPKVPGIFNFQKTCHREQGAFITLALNRFVIPRVEVREHGGRNKKTWLQQKVPKIPEPGQFKG